MVHVLKCWLTSNGCMFETVSQSHVSCMWIHFKRLLAHILASKENGQTMVQAGKNLLLHV